MFYTCFMRTWILSDVFLFLLFNLPLFLVLLTSLTCNKRLTWEVLGQSNVYHCLVFIMMKIILNFINDISYRFYWNCFMLQALTRARVPIAKLMDPVTELSCDICVNNLLAVVNTKLLKDYAQIDERLRQLAFIVKHWAKSRRVNETYQGTLSSYAWVALLLIHE